MNGIRQIPSPFSKPRRKFLSQATAVAAIGATPTLALQLAAMSAASAATASDYKAIVCVYLDGGMDSLHAVTPYDATNYNAFAGYRPGLVTARSQLSALNPVSSQGAYQVALHPALSGLKTLFDAKRLAIVTGLGQLDYPVTRAGLYDRSQALPVAAGSHNDGNSYAHTLGAEGTRYGWGGKMLDLLSSANPDSTFASINVGYSNAFGSGVSTQIIAAPSEGDPQNIAGLDGPLFGSTVASNELAAMLKRTAGTNALESDYARMNRLVMDSSAQLKTLFANTATLAPIPVDTSLANYTVAWRDNDLAKSLRTVLRTINQQSVLNAKRQVFFVSLKGFDTHGDMISQLDQQLFIKINAALTYFQSGLEALGLQNQVTTFTTSEFGRCLTTNGNGTDHGWGGVGFVLGGAVKGGDIYGKLTDVAAGGSGYESLGGGPVPIPTIANEQYGASLAKWFGLSDGQITDVFPNLSRFSSRNLGFL